MSEEQKMELLREGQFLRLYDEGELFVSDIKLAYKKGWIDYESAITWTEILMDV